MKKSTHTMLSLLGLDSPILASKNTPIEIRSTSAPPGLLPLAFRKTASQKKDYTTSLEYYKYYYEQKPLDPRLEKPTYVPK